MIVVILFAFISSGGYQLWTRWGRVGEDGQNTIGCFDNLEAAIKSFKKKFLDKTKNQWDNRENFTPAPGKYMLIDMDDGDEECDEKVFYLELVASLIRYKVKYLFF